jgi:hypothetical protein
MNNKPDDITLLSEPSLSRSELFDLKPLGEDVVGDDNDEEGEEEVFPEDDNINVGFVFNGRDSGDVTEHRCS